MSSLFIQFLILDLNDIRGMGIPGSGPMAAQGPGGVPANIRANYATHHQRKRVTQITREQDRAEKWEAAGGVYGSPIGVTRQLSESSSATTMSLGPAGMPMMAGYGLPHNMSMSSIGHADSLPLGMLQPLTLKVRHLEKNVGTGRSFITC